MNDVSVRPVRTDDAPQVRSLVTRALLAAGLAPPNPDLDQDLVDLSYYDHEGRGMWVAERDHVVVGCVAMDRGDPGSAVLRRLAGGALDDLLETVLAEAFHRGLSTVETVLPPGIPGTRDALERAGFSSPPGASAMLMRRPL